MAGASRRRDVPGFEVTHFTRRRCARACFSGRSGLFANDSQFVPGMIKTFAVQDVMGMVRTSASQDVMGMGKTFAYDSG